MDKEIGIIGDYKNSKTQIAINESIEHSNRELGFNTRYRWIDTTTLNNENYSETLKQLDGIWSASGSPFKSLNGSLNAIRYARENKVPHIGTCAGYQHVVLEFAKNVLKLENAQHAEYLDDLNNPDSLITKMKCSLAGTKGNVLIKENTLAKKIYAENKIEVDFFCSFGLNDKYSDIFNNSDFRVSGVDEVNAIRIIELIDHPFFVATLFVPQVNSSYENPNPLITEFVRKVNE